MVIRALSGVTLKIQADDRPRIRDCFRSAEQLTGLPVTAPRLCNSAGRVPKQMRIINDADHAVEARNHALSASFLATGRAR
jgi:hypothetical protein